MKVRNRSSKGKFVHLKINGVASQVKIKGFETLDLPYVTDVNQFVLNGHEKALMHVEGKFGINLGYAGLEIIGEPGTVDPIVYQSIFITAATGGTTTVGNDAHVEVRDGSDYAFTINAENGHYISAATINGFTFAAVSGATSLTEYTMSLTSITQTKTIDIDFGIQP